MQTLFIIINYYEIKHLKKNLVHIMKLDYFMKISLIIKSFYLALNSNSNNSNQIQPYS